jgi:hypothetical protein
MSSTRSLRIAALFVCVASLSTLSSATLADTSSERKFGRKIVAEYDLPPEQIAKFAAFEPSAPDKHESTLTNTLLAKTEDWSGPPLNAVTSDNPYTIVVTLTGTAKADGPAATLWNSGWEIRSENGNQTRLTVHPGLAKTEAKAGETFTVTAPGGPISFKEDRNVAVSLALVNARNIEIKSVHVQIWSGMAPTSWLEMLGPIRWVLLGVVLVVLWWFWIRPR